MRLAQTSFKSHGFYLLDAKYKEKSKLFVQEKLIEKVPGDILWKQAYEELFERDYNTIAQEIEDFRKSRKR